MGKRKNSDLKEEISGDMNKKYLLFGFIAFIASCSLDKGKAYEEIIPIASEGWPASQKHIFEMPVTDTAKAYDLMIHFRNTGRYAYSNIWVFIETTSPKGNSIKDTFEIVLADDLGRWLGKGIGDINYLLVPYKENILFPVKGVYKVSITQAMREKTLEGVLDIGLRLQVHQ